MRLPGVSVRKNAIASTGVLRVFSTWTVCGDSVFRRFSVKSHRTLCREDSALAKTTTPSASRIITAAPAP